MIKNLYQYWLISKSGIFDRNYYLLTYPDVRAADVNPLWHFIKIGWKEGRNPTGFFNTKFYLENNPDVRINGINPLVHYIKFGLNEGRKPRPEHEEKQYDENVEYKIVYPVDISQTSADDIDELEAIDATVSVIIPTKNAGEDFEFLLKMLKNQVGIKKIEIVIVDSGSTDNTTHLANEFGAKIISIPPEEFSHADSRNLGAENAFGDYLLFIVQDALPPTRTWLFELLSKLINLGVSAVSCAETPRQNADLFYRVISWNHYNFLGVNEKDRILTMPEKADYINLRQNGQLSDLSCLIKRELFLDYKYKIHYAEDLDLGIRLISDGYNLAFLGSIRVIHSHNRPAFYFLKRGYVDNLYLSEIFTDYLIVDITFQELIPLIIITYNYFTEVLLRKIEKIDPPISPDILISRISEATESINQFKTELILTKNYNMYVDQDFIDFLNFLANFVGPKGISDRPLDLLIQPFMGLLITTQEYLNNTYEIIDSDLFEEIKFCIFKELSMLFGSYLAYCQINHDDEEKAHYSEIHSKLTKEV